jgi:hypothetical protein
LDKVRKSNARIRILYRIEKCDAIGFRHIYTFDERDALDALASKFARNSDILFQKIFKIIIYLTKEDLLSLTK